MEKTNKLRKPSPITVKGIGKRGKNPHVDFNPGQVKEDLLSEAPVKVKARSAKTGRVITRRFKSPEDAAKHYHKWLTSRRLRTVQLTAEEALANKANDYGLPVDMIEAVYCRSADTWIPESNSTQEQWAFAGVNSFLEGGRAFDLNEDLITEAVYRITAKTSNKSLGKLSSRKDALGKQARTELERRKKAEAASKYGNKKVAAAKLQKALVGQGTITPTIAKKIITTLKINPKTAVAKSLNKVANKHVQKKKIAKEVQKHLKSAEHIAAEKAAKKAERQALKVKLAKKEERLKNQRLTAKAAAAREREDRKAREEAERIANLVKDALAQTKAAENAERVKNIASENVRKLIQPDVAKPEPKKTVLDTVRKFFSKKKTVSDIEIDDKPRYSTRVTHPKPPSTAKEEEDFIKRMESPLNGHLRTVRNLDMYRHLKAKREGKKPFNPEN